MTTAVITYSEQPAGTSLDGVRTEGAVRLEGAQPDGCSLYESGSPIVKRRFWPGSGADVRASPWALSAASPTAVGVV